MEKMASFFTESCSFGKTESKGVWHAQHAARGGGFLEVGCADAV